MPIRSLTTLRNLVLLVVIGGWPLPGLTVHGADTATGPFLWRLEGPRPSYVFGTIHLTDPVVTTLKPVVARAIEGSDVVMCELPLDAESLAKTAKALLSADQPLSVALPKDLYARAAQEIKRVNPNADLAAMDRMRIWAFTELVSTLDEMARFPNRKALDMIIYEKAQAAGKEVGGLETLEEQLAVMSGLTRADEIEMLRAALDELDHGRKEGFSKLDEMRAFYLAGDLNVLYAKLIRETRDLPAKVRESYIDTLFTKRNRHMASRIHGKRLIAPQKSCFFAVGAGHLPGPMGVLKLLENLGYKLTRVTE